MRKVDVRLKLEVSLAVVRTAHAQFRIHIHSIGCNVPGIMRTNEQPLIAYSYVVDRVLTVIPTFNALLQVFVKVYTGAWLSGLRISCPM